MDFKSLEPFNLWERFKKLTQQATDKYGVTEDQVHIGHLMLEGLRGDPEYVFQIDAATNEKHTNLEVAALSSKLADAMKKSGLKTGDHVVMMGPNNIWLSLPFYACHYNGYATCTIDPCTPQRELEALFSNVRPKLVFCSSISKDTVQKVLAVIHLKSRVVVFQGPYNLDAFIKEFEGNENNFKPATFDKNEIIAWLVLTSGTTGMPKAAAVTYDALYNNVADWWKDVSFRVERVFAISSLQWLSSLIYFSSSPIIGCTRIQTSAELTSKHLREIINKYKPQFAGFAPYLLRQFVQQEIDACDLSCFLVLGIAGGVLDQDVFLKLKEKCKAFIVIVYGMTETLASLFRYLPDSPLGSVGTVHPTLSYKLVDDDDNEINEPNKVGELWVKGGHFFKEYLNNPEETAKTLTPDGWLKTGDLLSRDENNFYYFHERKKLIIKYKLLHVAPLEIESIIKKHPKVSEVVVVGIPDPDYTQLSTAAVMTKDGSRPDPSEIFQLVNKELPVHKRLHGGLFYVNEFPLTPGGKINRKAVLELALEAEKTIDPNSRT